MDIPPQTNRFHLPWSDPRCDTITFLNMAARRGYRYVDLNTVISADDTAWNLHWGTGPNLNHYDWIWTGRRNRFGREIRRPMTGDELHRDVDQWSDAAIARWRRSERGGPKPATVAKRQAQARRRALVPCWELKSRDFAVADVAAQLLEDVRRGGGRAYFMTLVTKPAWGPKLRAVHQAGGQTALLADHAPRPSDLDNWAPYIDRVWGSFR